MRGFNRARSGGWLEELACDSSCCSTKRNRLALFFDGDEVFEAMVEDIGMAERFVHLEMYMFLSDGIGEMIAEALMERAQAGVPVLVVYDGIGSLEADAKMFRRMSEVGVIVEIFRPVAPWRKRSGILGRNHRKNLIVDGRVAYNGGMNLGDVWSRKASGGEVWRDTHLRIEGPGAAACDLLFRETWEKVGGGEINCESFYEIGGKGPGESDCLIIGGSGFLGRKAIRRLYSGAFSHACEKVEMTVPYFIPPRRMVDAMKKAEARGVEVEVLVPGKSDVRLADWLREGVYPALMKDGVSFHEYQHSVLHAKSMLVDDRLAIIGSANFDFLSISMNREQAVLIDEAEIVCELKEQRVRDLARSIEVVRETAVGLPWWRRLIAWVGTVLIRKL